MILAVVYEVPCTMQATRGHIDRCHKKKCGTKQWGSSISKWGGRDVKGAKDGGGSRIMYNMASSERQPISELRKTKTLLCIFKQKRGQKLRI